MSFVRIETPSKRLLKDPVALERVLNSINAKTAHTLATILKRRVAYRGINDQGFKGYSTKHKRYISPRYPTSGRKDRTGSFFYMSSRQFHQQMGTKHGSFNVNKSAGMWSGLSIVVTSSRKSRILFRGRSEGQGMVWFKPSKAQLERSKRAKQLVKMARKAKKAGIDPQWENSPHWEAVKGQIIKSPDGPYWKVNAKGEKQAKGKRVSNALKAWTVFEKSRVNILAVQNAELSSLTVAITSKAVDAIVEQFGPIKGLKIPKNEVARIMAKSYEVTRAAKDLR